MGYSETSNYNLRLVNPGTEENSWGNHVNWNFVKIDEMIYNLGDPTKFSHNDFKEIQGGSTTERYHLSLDDYNGIVNTNSALTSTNVAISKNDFDYYTRLKRFLYDNSYNTSYVDSNIQDIMGKNVVSLESMIANVYLEASDNIYQDIRTLGGCLTVTDSITLSTRGATIHGGPYNTDKYKTRIEFLKGERLVSYDGTIQSPGWKVVNAEISTSYDLRNTDNYIARLIVRRNADGIGYLWQYGGLSLCDRWVIKYLPTGLYGYYYDGKIYLYGSTVAGGHPYKLAIYDIGTPDYSNVIDITTYSDNTWNTITTINFPNIPKFVEVNPLEIPSGESDPVALHLTNYSHNQNNEHSGADANTMTVNYGFIVPYRIKYNNTTQSFDIQIYKMPASSSAGTDRLYDYIKVRIWNYE